MNPPPPSNQPALDRILAEVNELSYEDSKGAWDIITRLKTLKATPAPAGDDALRGLARAHEAISYWRHSYWRECWNKQTKRLDEEMELTAQLETALSDAKTESAVREVGLRGQIGLLETALAETRRELTAARQHESGLERDLARTREELANEKGQWELEANNAGRLATALAAKEAEVWGLLREIDSYVVSSTDGVTGETVFAVTECPVPIDLAQKIHTALKGTTK